VTKVSQGELRWQRPALWTYLQFCHVCCSSISF